MKQFSLEEYLKNPSRKVVTRNGRSVRIICTDRKSKYNCPIIALIEQFGGEEDFLCYPTNGEWPTCKNIDLFFAPEKHEGWTRVYKTGNISYLDNCIWPTEEAAKKCSNDYYVATVKIEWEE